MAERNNKSVKIKRKKGEDRVRDRPEALLGSNGLDGAKHTVIELLGNITDEHLAGFCDKAEIELKEDHSMVIRDYGSGVPLGWNEDEKEWNYFLVYEDLYAGGKYEDMQEELQKIEAEGKWDTFRFKDYPYLITIGLNGLGAAATQYTSEFFHVISYSNGIASEMRYEKGRHIWDELKVYETDEPDGTYIHYKPDAEVFFDVKIPSKWLESQARNLSIVSGMEVTFNNKGKVTVFKPKTIEEVAQESCSNSFSASNFVHCLDKRKDICVCHADVVIGSSGLGSMFFHNMVEVHGGVHSGSFNYALADFFKDIAAEDGIRIKETDYSGKFSVIVSALSNKMSLRGQTKDSLDDPYIYNCLYECIYNKLKMEYQKGTQWLLDIVEEAKANARNRIAVAEMSKNLREIEKTTKKYKASERFSPSESYLKGDVGSTEIFLVEGNSAGVRVKTARSYAFQCVLPIRGKTINVYKASIDKLIANNEIKDMIAAFGCGVDLGIDGYDGFDITKLKVDKVILLADADIDGKHINALLFLIMYRLFPELLYQGKVYLAYTPLYALVLRDGSCEYCYSLEERNIKRAEIGEQNIVEIKRFKGLGETSADMLWETTLNPEKRVMKQLKIERNDMELQDVLEVLFGSSTDRRKKAILGSMMDGFEDILEGMESLSKHIEGLGLDESLDIEEVVI